MSASSPPLLPPALRSLYQQVRVSWSGAPSRQIISGNCRRKRSSWTELTPDSLTDTCTHLKSSRSVLCCHGRSDIDCPSAVQRCEFFVRCRRRSVVTTGFHQFAVFLTLSRANELKSQLARLLESASSKNATVGLPASHYRTPASCRRVSSTCLRVNDVL